MRQGDRETRRNRIRRVLAVTGFLLLIWSSCLIAAEVGYQFVSVDVFPEDIDDDGTLLVNTSGNGFINTVTTINPKNSRKNVSFECGDTYGAALSGGIITGYCIDGAFVRQKDGTLLILSALGQNAMGLGIARDGTVGGQFCTPNGPPNYGCTIHGFTWHADRGYKTIDYLDGRPGSHTYSIVLAPISNGRVLGAYSVADFNNNTLEAGYYLYDNGSFDTTSLPRTFEYIGGPGAYISDMNELGQVIIQRWNTLTPGLELYDDGILYQITGWPVEWHLQQLNGSNNEGQFTGSYIIQTGIDPYYGWPVYKSHGFVATPAETRRHGRQGDKETVFTNK